MPTKISLQIDLPGLTGDSVRQTFFPPELDGRRCVDAVARAADLVSSGIREGSSLVEVVSEDSAAFTKTITCVQADATAADIVSIGGVDLEVVAATPGADEFVVGASNTSMATNLTAAINANATLNRVLVATSLVGVVTLRPLVGGGAWFPVLTLTATVGSGTPFAFASTNGSAVVRVLFENGV